MDLDDWHVFFISICVTLVFLSCTPLILSYRPNQIEPYIVLALLGENDQIGPYLSNAEQKIEIGENVHWTLYLHNHMEGIQYIEVKVKILNTTTPSPNSASTIPSPVNTVYKIRHCLKQDETWLYPIDWSLIELSTINNVTRIEEININGENCTTEVTAIMGTSFRVVIELWTYDVSPDDFVFGWRSGDKSYGPWNQVWFNVMST